VSDFDSLNKWHPGFASDELVSGGTARSAREKTHHQGRPDIHRKAVAVRRGASFLSATRSLIAAAVHKDYVSTVSVRTGPAGMTKVDLERELQAQELCR